MAARKNAYVYLIHKDGIAIYVGKGTGSRAKQQANRFNGNLHLLEEDITEREAYKRERRWIKELKPQANKCPGGSGSFASKPVAQYGIHSKSDLELKRIMAKHGTRVGSAWVLMWAERLSPGFLKPSEVDSVRGFLRGQGIQDRWAQEGYPE